MRALLFASNKARRELGEVVAVANDPRDLQTCGCRALAAALLCRLSRARSLCPRFLGSRVRRGPDGGCDAAADLPVAEPANSGTDRASGEMPVGSRMQVMPAVVNSVAANAQRPRWAVSTEERSADGEASRGIEED